MKKILLIGDSIRMGYDKYVKLAFEDVAEVCYPKDNCRFAAYILRHIYDWQKGLECGSDVDLVHWNAGLWDTLFMPDGENHTPIEIYKYYIERVCISIKQLFPNAKVVFATSTPVVEERFTGVCKRYNKDIELYNAAAIDIVKKHGFGVNNLYEITKNVPLEYYSDMTHLYTKEGTKLLTDKVVDCIEKTLDINAKKLDYDKLFSENESVIGM